MESGTSSFNIIKKRRKKINEKNIRENQRNLRDRFSTDSKDSNRKKT